MARAAYMGSVANGISAGFKLLIFVLLVGHLVIDPTGRDTVAGAVILGGGSLGVFLLRLGFHTLNHSS